VVLSCSFCSQEAGQLVSCPACQTELAADAMATPAGKRRGYERAARLAHQQARRLRGGS